MILVLAVGAFVALWLYSQESDDASSAGQIPIFPGDGNSDSVVSAVTGAGTQFQNNLDNIAQAIFTFEGGNKPSSVQYTNNNPGNIGGINASFADIGDGWDALYNWIQSHAAEHPSWSISQFINYYVNGDINSTAQHADNYSSYVASYLGVSPNTTVASLLGYS
ncbi:MAG TPA: hypothetical protein VHB45_14315 [Alloacidobacterium sp.]|nr:hypothetical protein [Alloacidobacterium sp.]